MSTMKNHLGSFLSRLVLPGLVALLILSSPALVRADAIRTFDVSGTAQNVSGMKLDSCANGATCTFSGMFKVDTTTGTVESSGFDITLPGLPAFDVLRVSHPILNGFFNGWVTYSEAGLNVLALPFTTAPTPASLKGFTGGSIVDGVVNVGRIPLYFVPSGSITPAPEPSSLVLFVSGMLALGLAWRFGKKVGHSLRA